MTTNPNAHIYRLSNGSHDVHESIEWLISATKKWLICESFEIGFPPANLDSAGAGSSFARARYHYWGQPLAVDMLEKTETTQGHRLSVGVNARFFNNLYDQTASRKPTKTIVLNMHIRNNESRPLR
jgi:hypothetical protein